MRGAQPLPAVIAVIVILSLAIGIVAYFGLGGGSASSSLGQIEITQPVDSLAGQLVLREEAEPQCDQIEPRASNTDAIPSCTSDAERELDEEAATQAAEEAATRAAETPVP